MVILLQGMGTLRMLADNAAWMAGLSDDTFISQISIPGTHDAGTGHGVNNYLIISGKIYAVTQEKTLTEQWNSGIRAFDLRPSVDGSQLRIYHGLISTDLYFDDALKTLLAEKGYPIARRTVAKYREQMGIPIARMRR